MRSTLPIVLATVASLLVHGVTRAEDASPSSSAATDSSARASAPARAVLIVPGPRTQPWVRNGDWGWFVVASSIFVGTGATGFGLGQTCDEGVNSCSRVTSLALWGGLGVAAIGTALGLIVVQAGHASSRDKTFATVNLGPLGDFRLAPTIDVRR